MPYDPDNNPYIPGDPACYDLKWIIDQILNLLSQPGGVSSVNGQTGAVVLVIPTATSELINDSGFITSAPVTSVNGQTGDVIISAGVTSVNGQTGDVLLTIPTVPTDVSAFNNDVGYITLADLPIYNGGII